MTDTRKAGIALIAGSIGNIVTMAIHPVGSGPLSPAQAEHLIIGSAIAHSLAILSVVLLVLGACGLTLRLAAPDRLAFSGLVFFLFAAVAIFIAAAVSGFIVPSIMRHMVRDTPESAPYWRITISSVFQINQAFARIYTVLGSIAVALWSASAIRNGGMGRGMATYGCIVAPILVAGILAGHLTMDVHGMLAVVLAQAIWFIGVGIGLYREDSLIAA